MTVKPALAPPPLYIPDEKQHRIELAQAVRNLYRGKGPSPIDSFTLATSATSTTLTDVRIGYFSHIEFMPQTANAAAIKSSIYVAQSTQLNGQAVVSHDSTANTDCTFRVLIWG